MARYLCWPMHRERLGKGLEGWPHPESRAALPLAMNVAEVPCLLRELHGVAPVRILAAYDALSEESIYLRFMRRNGRRHRNRSRNFSITIPNIKSHCC